MAAPRIEIHYCAKCRFLLRASWFAQELLTTFEGQLGEVALVPAGGGLFEIRMDGNVIASNGWDRKMPDVSEVKRLVRDRITPDQRIGHE
jgi:selenoprotein W-related protein